LCSKIKFKTKQIKNWKPETFHFIPGVVHDIFPKKDLTIAFEPFSANICLLVKVILSLYFYTKLLSFLSFFRKKDKISNFAENFSQKAHSK
jgi:hypothetical protein